jgi:hypothetical protein
MRRLRGFRRLRGSVSGDVSGSGSVSICISGLVFAARCGLAAACCRLAAACLSSCVAGAFARSLSGGSSAATRGSSGGRVSSASGITQRQLRKRRRRSCSHVGRSKNGRRLA